MLFGIKVSLADKDKRPYHFPFSVEKPKENTFRRLFSVMSQGIWLNDEAFSKLRELNYLLLQMPGGEGEAINFGKQHYREIAETRDALEGILAADMLDLHKVGQFLKRKKDRKDPGFQPVQAALNWVPFPN